MTARAAFFRYAWITERQVEGLLPNSDCTANPAMVAQGRELAEAARTVGGAIATLAAFARQPRFLNPPGAAFCARALAWAEQNARPEAVALARWCAAIVMKIEDRSPDAMIAHEQHVLLTRLLDTDYPVLLRWSAPDAARFQFDLAGGTPHWRTAILDDPRKRRQAVRLFLSYAGGALGRMAPRDGWTGTGFAVLAVGAPPLVLDHAHERIDIAPDLAWFAAYVLPDGVTGPAAGECAWTYLDRVLATFGDEGDGWRMALSTAHRDAGTLDPWDDATVERFLQTHAVHIQAPGAPPHRWWLTRMLREQVTLPAITVPARAPNPPTDGAIRAPYPLRLPENAVLVRADELHDWIVDASARAATPPLGNDDADCAEVIRIGPLGVRRLFIEPNPRRVTEPFAALLARPPLYQATDLAPRLAVPATIIDNRLLRCSGSEVLIDQVPPNADAMLRTALNIPVTRARELASPRYRHAPDIEPIWFKAASAVSLSFGRVDLVARIWLIAPEQAQVLARHSGTTTRLALFFRLEVQPAIGMPDWADLLIDGKNSRLPCFNALAFERLLTALRSATAPIAVIHRHAASATAPIELKNGGPATIDLYQADAKGSPIS